MTLLPPLDSRLCLLFAISLWRAGSGVLLVRARKGCGELLERGMCDWEESPRLCVLDVERTSPSDASELERWCSAVIC